MRSFFFLKGLFLSFSLHLSSSLSRTSSSSSLSHPIFIFFLFLHPCSHSSFVSPFGPPPISLLWILCRFFWTLPGLMVVDIQSERKKVASWKKNRLKRKVSRDAEVILFVVHIRCIANHSCNLWEKAAFVFLLFAICYSMQKCINSNNSHSIGML